jgi:hypothetical protein
VGDFGASLQWIATDLRNQYQLSFQSPASVKAGKAYSLKVAVSISPDAPNLAKQMKVRHRQFFIGQNR